MIIISFFHFNLNIINSLHYESIKTHKFSESHFICQLNKKNVKLKLATEKKGGLNNALKYDNVSLYAVLLKS